MSRIRSITYVVLAHGCWKIMWLCVLYCLPFVEASTTASLLLEASLPVLPSIGCHWQDFLFGENIQAMLSEVILLRSLLCSWTHGISWTLAQFSCVLSCEGSLVVSVQQVDITFPLMDISVQMNKSFIALCRKPVVFFAMLVSKCYKEA